MASRYPSAGTTQRFDGTFGGSYVPGFTWRGVLHSTETTSWPSYKGGAVAPHFTVHPRLGQVRQHFDISRPSRALQHLSGTIDTNNARAVQIEIIAYSDNGIAAKTPGALRVDSLTAEQLAPIAELMRWIEAQTGINRSAVKTWKPYPSSAGTGNGVRMSDAAWRTFNGWCGHQHVPHNDHGDPSDINITALLEGDDMPTAKEVVDELFARRMVNPLDPTGATTARFDTMFEQTYGQARTAASNVDAIAAAVVAALPPAATGGLTVDQVKQAFVDVLTNGTGGAA